MARTLIPRPFMLIAALLIGCAGLPVQVAQAGQPDAARHAEMAERALACTGCHGEQGVATPDGFFPRIAGKPAGYLFNQLRHFQQGSRVFPAMTALVAHLPEAYLDDFARYFAALDLPYPPPVPVAQSAADAQRAVDLITRGDPALQVPACVSCHGTSLTGVTPAVPGLLGLPRDYLNAQLGAWRTGARMADNPDCMHSIVSRLQADDLSRVTTWLANQPVPANGKPADRFPDPDAVPDCGSFNAPDAEPMAITATRRGEYLARIGNCAGCHSLPGGARFAGGVAIETPFGRVFGSNLTPDRQTGIGAWQADDFWRAMTQGVRPDGRLLNPVFPYPFYAGMTRADSDALFAWLQSLPAVNQAQREHQLRFPYGTSLAIRAWRWLYFEPDATREGHAPLARSAPSEVLVSTATRHATDLARGRYLFETLAHCQACHGERNALGGFARDDRSGGSRLPGDGGYAPSLSDVAQAGLTEWPLEDIVQFLRQGRSPAASPQGLMTQVVQHSTRFLTEADARALARWLQTLAPDSTQRRGVDNPARSSASGRESYERLCADCHGVDGEGRDGVYPPLAGRRGVLQDDASNAIRMVLYGGFGIATPEHPRPWGMPGFVHRLNDREVASLLNHVRASWGNQAVAITPDRVQKAR